MKYAVRIDGHPDTIDVELNGEAVQLHGELLGKTPTLRMLSDHTALLQLGSRQFRVALERHQHRSGTRGRDDFTVWVNGERFPVSVMNERGLAIERFSGAAAQRSGPQRLVAPMPGLIVRVQVKEGDTVAAGQGLIVMEAMKMENELRASHSGVVKSVMVEAGRPVEKGALLLEVDTPQPLT